MSAEPRASEPSPADPLASFGTNEWLVYEMYQQYLKDPQSLDPAWWEFFADYSRSAGAGEREPATGPAANGHAPGGPTGTAPDVSAEAERSVAEPPAARPAPSSSAATAAATAAPPATRGDERARTAPPASGEAPAPPAASGNGAAAADPAARAATTPPGGEPSAADGAARGAPARTGQPAGGSPPAPAGGTDHENASAPGERVEPLRGMAARVVTNMAASLEVPTATSVRSVPAKLLIDNRTIINNHLRRGRGGKVSFTHIIGYAVVRAVESMPAMNCHFAEVDGRPAVVTPAHVNLGLAIDLARPDGTRALVVPSLKAAEEMDFTRFWTGYEDLVRRARANRLGPDDYAGTTLSLTNPGTIGTVHSVPRLMAGQGTIVGVGALEYPAEFQGASAETLARLAVSKVLTLTSTYDHRVIQGAQSGDFLRRLHELLLGADGFYDGIFRDLRIPYEPIRWVSDITASHDDEVGKPARVLELVHAYRVRGHLMADTNPLEFELRRHPDLDVVAHGLSLWDLDREFPTGGFGGAPVMKLRDILGVLRDSYCRTVGIEYMHIQDPGQRAWIQSRVEHGHEKPPRAEQLQILAKLNQAEAFETFLQTKFVGQKRFSLEGGETLIPLLDAVCSAATAARLDEVVIGMAHRGRLNVLTNIVGKSSAQVFREFEGNLDPRTTHGSGDVKYHLGAEGTYRGADGSVRVSLASNPSHLEAVDPVLEGVVRAKQDRIDRGEAGFTVLPVLVHGDAAFAGQGVVAETLNLSQLRGYRTGGTVHVVVNNQVGFTTSPTAARSSVYATDAARMIQAPIFHVNGDDPEACVRVAKLAFDFRQEFKKDVVIDMLCYRRRGHNEADDPSLTQPEMYDLIDAKRSVRKLYTEALVGRGDITLDEAEQALRDYQAQLERVFAETRDAGSAPTAEPHQAAEVAGPVRTAIDPDIVKRVAESQLALPAGFAVHKRLLPQLQRRAALFDDDSADWAMGETLAFGALLLSGRPIRLAGQDSRRGTFGQRHAVIVDRRTGAEYTPLAHLAERQGHFHVYDSLLSEYAAMGFEYGYSVGRPEALVLWEAQFGDFANGAQSIVDEFISSGEAKWGQRSSLVLLLPHGYEGQGPDHSSARIERYLALCAEDNMRVAVPSTPANYCHLLLRQALSPVRKPLVVFTPKSMLRLKAATSRVVDFTEGAFQPVIVDPPDDPSAVRQVLLCSGKISYDLLAARARAGDTASVVLRLEQLYPLPVDDLVEALADYPDAELVWVQEEPANGGGWPFVALHLPEHLGGRPLRRVSRPASASPAAGSHHRHDEEHAALLARLFG